jgi:SAM-dependent methyltransferase
MDKRNESPIPVGQVDFGGLRRLTPVSRAFGFDRGQCIDRHYIEQFLEEHAGDVAGRVLEVADNNYTRAFGGDKVTQSDVLHLHPGEEGTTCYGDLADPNCPLETACFDCIVFTQTLLVIHDFQQAVRTLHRILKPAGVLLATFPGISQISRYDMERWGDYWRFTDLSARRTFGDVFGQESVQVTTRGNVLVACAFLHGLAASELTAEELSHTDPDYQVLLTVRAQKTSD